MYKREQENVCSIIVSDNTAHVSEMFVYLYWTKLQDLQTDWQWVTCYARISYSQDMRQFITTDKYVVYNRIMIGTVIVTQ